MNTAAVGDCVVLDDGQKVRVVEVEPAWWGGAHYRGCLIDDGKVTAVLDFESEDVEEVIPLAESMLTAVRLA